jgi:hypothetical protein
MNDRENTVNFAEWFDVNNIDHIRAYVHLRITGMWPEGFIPDNVEMGSIWQVDLMQKMAEEWMIHMLRIANKEN